MRVSLDVDGTSVPVTFDGEPTAEDVSEAVEILRGQRRGASKKSEVKRAQRPPGNASINAGAVGSGLRAYSGLVPSNPVFQMGLEGIAAKESAGGGKKLTSGSPQTQVRPTSGNKSSRTRNGTASDLGWIKSKGNIDAPGRALPEIPDELWGGNPVHSIPLTPGELGGAVRAGRYLQKRKGDPGWMDLPGSAPFKFDSPEQAAWYRAVDPTGEKRRTGQLTRDQLRYTQGAQNNVGTLENAMAHWDATNPDATPHLREIVKYKLQSLITPGSPAYTPAIHKAAARHEANLLDLAEKFREDIHEAIKGRELDAGLHTVTGDAYLASPEGFRRTLQSGSGFFDPSLKKLTGPQYDQLVAGVADSLGYALLTAPTNLNPDAGLVTMLGQGGQVLDDLTSGRGWETFNSSDPDRPGLLQTLIPANAFDESVSLRERGRRGGDWFQLGFNLAHGGVNFLKEHVPFSRFRERSGLTSGEAGGGKSFRSGPEEADRNLETATRVVDDLSREVQGARKTLRAKRRRGLSAGQERILQERLNSLEDRLHKANEQKSYWDQRSANEGSSHSSGHQESGGAGVDDSHVRSRSEPEPNTRNAKDIEAESAPPDEGLSDPPGRNEKDSGEKALPSREGLFDDEGGSGRGRQPSPWGGIPMKKLILAVSRLARIVATSAHGEAAGQVLASLRKEIADRVKSGTSGADGGVSVGEDVGSVGGSAHDFPSGPRADQVVLPSSTPFSVGDLDEGALSGRVRGLEHRSEGGYHSDPTTAARMEAEHGLLRAELERRAGGMPEPAVLRDAALARVELAKPRTSAPTAFRHVLALAKEAVAKGYRFDKFAVETGRAFGRKVGQHLRPAWDSAMHLWHQSASLRPQKHQNATALIRTTDLEALPAAQVERKATILDELRNHGHAYHAMRLQAVQAQNRLSLMHDRFAKGNRRLDQHVSRNLTTHAKFAQLSGETFEEWGQSIREGIGEGFESHLERAWENASLDYENAVSTYREWMDSLAEMMRDKRYVRKRLEEISEPGSRTSNAPRIKGRPLHLHHEDGKKYGRLHEMAEYDHIGGSNFRLNHPYGNLIKSEIDRPEFATVRHQHWQQWHKIATKIIRYVQ